MGNWGEEDQSFFEFEDVAELAAVGQPKCTIHIHRIYSKGLLRRGGVNNKHLQYCINLIDWCINIHSAILNSSNRLKIAKQKN